MSVQITEYIDVNRRALEFGCNIPSGLAFLPRNFETVTSKDELIHESTTLTLRVLWRQSEIPETKIERESDRFPCAQENYIEWIGPVIFISASILSRNPAMISVALGVISNYLTDWFKGIPRNKNIKLDFVVEQTKTKKYKRIHYDGDVNGLKDLDKIIREVSED